MKRTPKISEAEWEVMKVLWRTSPRTANDIVEELTGKTHWKRETIRTLINRLVQKKALGFEKKGRQYHYFPRVSEAEGIKAEAESFVRRIGGGSIEPMLAAFVEDKQLSAEKIARLLPDLKTFSARQKPPVMMNNKDNR
ncbi:MAG: BlaI/MecI/CopY family transcriptional regulator [Planctomycetota bacterium]|jgi:BlaI family penicillinase repressor